MEYRYDINFLYCNFQITKANKLLLCLILSRTDYMHINLAMALDSTSQNRTTCSRLQYLMHH